MSQYVCLTTWCYTTSHLHQFFSISPGRVFSLFSLVFRTSNFWSLRNLIKQLFHSRLLDMRLVIAGVYELNLNWHIENVFVTCTWFIFRPQTFNFYNQDVLVKLRRTSVLVVVVILFRRHASDKSQEAISWSRTWRFFLQCLSIKYVVSDHFRWGNIPVNQNKMRMCLHFAQIRTWHRCLKLSFFGLYIYVRSLKTVPSCFFKSEACSPRLVKLIYSTLTGNVATHRKIFAPFLFIGFARKMIPFFWFSLKLRSFLSLFSSDYQFCVVGFLIKQLFYSGLLDMKWS